MESGAFDFVLPLSYFPKLKNQPLKEEEKDAEYANDPEVPFNFSCHVKSSENFISICHPKGFEVIENATNSVIIQKLYTDLITMKRDIQVLFKTTSSEPS